MLLVDNIKKVRLAQESSVKQVNINIVISIIIQNNIVAPSINMEDNLKASFYNRNL